MTRWAIARSIGIVVGMAAEAKLVWRTGCAVGIGGGSPLGARRMARTLVDDGVTSLISFGLAGGLDPALPPATLILPETVSSNGRSYRCDPELRALLEGDSIPALMAAEAAVSAAAEKQRLWRETGAGAVDLESGAVAEVAAEAGIPFAVMRAICDPATRDLPRSAVEGLDSSGRIAFARIARILALNPREIVGLAALARDAARARRSLIRGAESLRRLAARDADPSGIVL